MLTAREAVTGDGEKVLAFTECIVYCEKQTPVK